MEKRRRERINHSLETLRLLMLENTHNEVGLGVLTLYHSTDAIMGLSHDYSDFLDLETAESKGGEGRDSGERGPVPEDGEGG